MALQGTAFFYWLKELHWARQQILSAKTPREKELAIAYHKSICKMTKD